MFTNYTKHLMINAIQTFSITKSIFIQVVMLFLQIKKHIRKFIRQTFKHN